MAAYNSFYLTREFKTRIARLACFITLGNVREIQQYSSNFASKEHRLKIFGTYLDGSVLVD